MLGLHIKQLVLVLLLTLAGLAPAASAKTTYRDLPSHADWLVAMRESRDMNLSWKVMRTRTLFHEVAWKASGNISGRWANPVELLNKGSGNFLDLIAAYYFTLRGMGLRAEDIRVYLGKMRTLDKQVPHILLAIGNHGPVYYIDPLQEIPLLDEPPGHFTPSMAINETGAWPTNSLRDTSVWTALGQQPGQIAGWQNVCDTTLPLLELEHPVKVAAYVEPEAIIEAAPPAARPMKVSAPAKPVKATRKTATTKPLKNVQ
jgi:hypothetical protein